MSSDNPSVNTLFQRYDTPRGAYAFDQIKQDDFLPAFKQAIADKRAEIEGIIASEEPPTFENTILALERAGETLEWVSGVFFNLLHAHSNDELMAISEAIIPDLSELSTYVLLSKPLFERIKVVYDERDSLGLDEEEMRLLSNCYEGFADSGALLDDAGKARLEELSLEMSQATLLYGQNNLKDQKRYRLHLTAPEEVAGMPESLLLQARERAEREERGAGWTFDLSAPSYVPFMQHCRHSHLREQMYLAKTRVGASGDEYDNTELVRRIVNGRLEEARLLGHKTFAHWALHKRMARTPEHVYQLLDQLLDAYKPVAQAEIERIAAFAKAQDPSAQMNSWDWSYWAEQYKQTHYHLDDEMLRPYFELGRVIEAVLGLATRLYGISFSERRDIPVYHHDVKVYEVSDEDGRYLGLLYTDFFPREGKQSGAWKSTFQDQYHEPDGKDHRPHVVLVMNFTPPTTSGPSLLTPGEVSTFLHEFGHALHALLSECRFSSLSGTSVTRDFVELPSQLMENWMGEETWLTTFALHHETGAPLPAEYLERMKQMKHFLVGYAACRQLSFGYLDMAWHSLEAPVSPDLDVKAFEDEAWAKALVLPPSPAGSLMSTSFGHIFSGGYAAGYYGYKWAEVLDADAFSLFKEAGIFDRGVATRFRKEVLSQGDKREAMELYKAFRGGEPTIEALLERDGISMVR